MYIPRSHIITICCSLIVFVGTTAASAANPIAKLLEQAEKSYNQSTPKDIANTRQSLNRDIRDLRKLLELTPQNIAAWEKYLKLKELEQHLRSPQPKDIAILQDVDSQFSSDQAGLGMREFVSLRNNLKFYLTQLQDAGNPDFKKQFAMHIAGLGSAIKSYKQNPQPKTFGQINAHIGWLSKRKQAGNLIQAVRDRYSHQNLHVGLSQRLIGSAIARDIDQTTPFNASLSGATVSGTANTHGNITATFTPNDKQASVAILFEGETDLDTVAVLDPVQVYATGAINSTAWTQINIDANGFTAVRPSASAIARICVYCIQTDLPWPIEPLVIGIAQQEVRNRQDASDESAARNAEGKLESQMEEEVDKIIDPLNQQYRKNVVERLRQIDAFPTNIALSTTTDRLYVDLLVGSKHQLGAPAPASVKVSKADLSLRLHQSAVNNLASNLFGGKSFTVREIQKLAEDLLGIPAPTGSVSKAEEISITFDDQRPVTVQFSNNTVTLSITGQEFISNRRTYPPMSFSFTYQFKKKSGGFQAKLVGEPLIIPPRLETAERKSLSLRETAIRRILRNRFDRDLNKQVDINEIPLPAKLGNMLPLLVTQLTTSEGWLTLSSNQKPAKP